MQLHTINENRDRADKVIGSILWAGRAFLYLNEAGYKTSKELKFEWHFGRHAHGTMLQMRTGFVGERELSFGIGIWHLFNFYFTLVLPFFPNWSYEHGDRFLGIRIFDEGLWISLWINDDESHSSDPFWKKTICIKPIDILLGRKNHERRDLRSDEFIVPMPEGGYPAKVTFFESTWKRPRWFWAEKLVRADIDMIKPIPVPGKGENSWDCGDDAIFGMTAPCTTIEECIKTLRDSAFRDRLKYGGSLDWQVD